MDLRPVAEIKLSAHSDGWTVWITYPDAGVDRPCSHGIGVGNIKLAKRLEKAINAGVVVTNQKIAKDDQGKTYVNDKSQVIGRKLNADLKRLGF